MQFKYLGYSSTPYTKQSILQIRNFRSDVTIYVKQPSGGVISKLTSWSVINAVAAGKRPYAALLDFGCNF